MIVLMMGLAGFTGYEWKNAQRETVRPLQVPVPPGPPPLPPLAKEPRHEEPPRKTGHAVHRKNAQKKERLLAKRNPSPPSDFVNVDFDRTSSPQPKGPTEAASEPDRPAGDDSKP